MNFDEPIDRRGTGSEKWDGCGREAGKAGVIPLWVADMDFPAPPELTRALAERAAHPVYGYTQLSETFYDTLADWYARRYGLELDKGHFLLGPGTVASLGIAVRSLTGRGDGVLLLAPVYGPFYRMIRLNGRETVEVPLRLKDGRYCFDEAALERGLAAAAARGLKVPLALFCSPHNPGGSVWEKAELECFLAFAARHGITVISDEIHGDFVYPPKTFRSMAAFPDYGERTVVVSSVNKSFNLGGLHTSYFITGEERLADALKRELRAMGYGELDIFSMIAAETAYRSCAYWLDEARIYLRANLEEAVRFINGIPGLRAFLPEGTYLIWTDASLLIGRAQLTDDRALVDLLEQEARVKLTPGSAFGRQGKGFIRINAACPRSQLMEGLGRLRDWAAGTGK
jgi:cystathionine beta-lyase